MAARKILIPIIGFGSAGGYRVLSELANQWLDEGNLVDFLVNHRFAKPYFPTKAGIIAFDVRGCTAAGPKDGAIRVAAATGNATSIYLGMLRSLQCIGKHYDIILANHSLTTFPVAIARTGKAKKFYYVQAYEPEYYQHSPAWKNRILQYLSLGSYMLPLRQVANAPIYIGFKGIRANEWVPPGIDESIFYRRDEPPNFPAARPWTIGVIGRHEPAKGTRYVLSAFERLAARDPYVRLKVAFGNLPDAWSHERAEVTVPCGDRELAEYYRSVDVLVAPGTVQLGACHYPVLEAMACGTPVITTGYLPANEDNSWIVPVHDSDAIVNALTRIHSGPRSELLKRLDLAANAVRPFYWPQVARQFLRIFEAST